MFRCTVAVGVYLCLYAYATLHLPFSHHWLAVFSAVAIALSQVCLVKEDKPPDAGAGSIESGIHPVTARAAAGTVVLTGHGSTPTEFTCFSPCENRMRQLKGYYVIYIIVQAIYSKIAHHHVGCIGLQDR